MPISLTSSYCACAVRASILITVMAAAKIGWAQSDDLRIYRSEEVFPSLGALIEKAMQQSPQMLMRTAEITLAEGNLLQVRSSMLPRLDSSVYYSANTTSVSERTSVSSRNDGIFYSVSASQPLYHWGALKAQADISRIGVELAEKNYAEAYRLLTVSIRQHYLMLIVRKAALKIAESSLSAAQAVLDVEEERLRAGRISEGDIMAPRLALDEARYGFERAGVDFAQAKRTLGRLAGVPELSDSDIPDSIPISQEYYGADRAVSRLDFFTAVGVDEALPLQILQAQIKQADLSYRIAKFRLYPKFAIVGSASQANTTNASQTSVVQVGVNSQSLNVQMVWSMFDGFATRGAKMNALASKRHSEFQRDAQRRAMLDQARDLESYLRLGSRAVRLADTRRYLAEDVMKRAADNLQRGIGTQKDLDNAVAAFNGAEFAAMQQRADLLTRWAEFLSLTGADPLLARLPVRYVKKS